MMNSNFEKNPSVILDFLMNLIGIHTKVDTLVDLRADNHGILFTVMAFYQICMFFATTKKLSIDVERLHFLAFYTKHCKCKVIKTAGHGKVIE